MKNLLSLITLILLLSTGCMGPINISYKGVSHYSNQNATTEGKIDNEHLSEARVDPVSDTDINAKADTKVDTADVMTYERQEKINENKAPTVNTDNKP